MENKLNQRQYDPYALNTPSGNLLFTEFVDSFSCYLLEALTGNFSITGNLTVNEGQVLFSDLSNQVVIGSNNSVLNSTDCSISGSNNLIANSNSSSLSGDGNTILGGSDNQIADSDDAIIIFGSQATISKHTGAAMITDGDSSRVKDSVRGNALTIDFSSGAFLKNDLFIDGDLFSTGDQSVFDSDVYISSTNSGLISGDLQVLGTAYNTGSRLQNLQNLIDSSGHLLGLLTDYSGFAYTELAGTGAASNSKIFNTGSILDTAMVKKAGHQVITGPKYFDVLTGERLNIGSTDRWIPTLRTSAGNSGDITFSPQDGYLYLCTGTNEWSRISLSVWPD